MSDIIHALVLGILQGFTEFLPVSSSAHLILLPKLMGWQDFGLPFDIAIHIGSLFAIVGYFAKDINIKKNINNLLLIAIATIPVGLSGLLFKHFVEHYMRSINLIAITTIIFGVILGIAYFYNSLVKKQHDLKDFSIKYAIFIGLAQAIAIIPGVSRSGITLTAGLILGFNILAASRISFLLAIPVIFLAGAKQSFDLIISNPLLIKLPTLSWPILLSGFLSSMVSSFAFIFLFFKYVNSIGMWPFVIYRILLGSLLWLISC